MIKKIVNHILWRVSYLKNIIIPQTYYAARLKKEVLSGPFKGLNYINSATGSVILPKLMGTYESELHFIWEEVRKDKYESFIDVGAGEGYYVAGCGKFIFNNKIPIKAFELTRIGQRNIQKMVALNDVKNVSIFGKCTLEILKKELNGKNCILLMDVEGSEMQLLDTTEIDFKNTDIVVELHPNAYNDIQEVLINRFQKSHIIKVIVIEEKRLPSDVKFPDWVIKKKNYLLDEFRGPQSWLWMKYKRIPQ
jgi:hypothetical protein